MSALAAAEVRHAPEPPEPPTATEQRLLENEGVRSAVDLVERCDTQLIRILGCSPARVRRLRASAALCLVPKTAKALLEARERHVASGFAALDGALGGGARRGSVTEFVGRAGAGKTQCCLTLAAACAARGHAVVYVDTESTFRPKRLWQIAEANGCREDARDLLKRVHVLRPGGCGELLAVLERGDLLQRAQRAQARLCVLDSARAGVRRSVVPSFRPSSLPSRGPLFFPAKATKDERGRRSPPSRGATSSARRTSSTASAGSPRRARR